MSGTLIDGVDYGPLAGLPGVWRGARGMDIAPEPHDDERNPYYETLVFHAAGDVTNAEEQVLSVVRYHQEVSRVSNDEVFHDQVGYWLWEAATGQIIQTLSIPRAVTLLAGGTARKERDSVILEVKAKAGDPDWGIIEAPFMQRKAQTSAYHHRLAITGDKLFYQETTLLDIYGKRGYEHTDQNVLTRQN